jgi:protein-tyrosine phosphatase
LFHSLRPEKFCIWTSGKSLKVAKACGIEFISFPIPDRETPESKPATLELVQRLAELVKEGKGLVIHCFAGIGRSSLIAACVLATLGIDPESAFRQITKSRGCEVP